MAAKKKSTAKKPAVKKAPAAAKKPAAKKTGPASKKEKAPKPPKAAQPKKEKAPKPPKPAKAPRKKPAPDPERKKVAEARKERPAVAKRVRQGTADAKKHYREGNKDCRTTRADANKPHREAIDKNKIDFGACQRAVFASTVPMVDALESDRVRLDQLNRIIPPPMPSPGARLNQLRWEEQLEQARLEVLRQDPQLATFLQSQLGPFAAYGSKASRKLREGGPGMAAGVGDRLTDHLLQKAHEGGWSPTSGLTHAPSMQLAHVVQVEDEVRRMMEKGPPSAHAMLAQMTDPLAAALSRVGGPSSAVAPSQVTPSAMTFPPVSSTGSANVDALMAQARASTRSGAASRRPPSTRSPTSARGQGPHSRAPKTVVSPGSEPRGSAGGSS